MILPVLVPQVVPTEVYGIAEEIIAEKKRAADAAPKKRRASDLLRETSKHQT